MTAPQLALAAVVAGVVGFCLLILWQARAAVRVDRERARFFRAFVDDDRVRVDEDTGWRPPALSTAAAAADDALTVRLAGYSGPNPREMPTRWRASAQHRAFARRGRARLTRRGRNDDDGDGFRRIIDDGGDEAALSLFQDLTVRALCAELFARSEAQWLTVAEGGDVEVELFARGYDADDARRKLLAVAALVDAMVQAAPAAAFPAELAALGEHGRAHVASGAESGTPVAVAALDDDDVVVVAARRRK